MYFDPITNLLIIQMQVPTKNDSHSTLTLFDFIWTLERNFIPKDFSLTKQNQRKIKALKVRLCLKKRWDKKIEPGYNGPKHAIVFI